MENITAKNTYSFLQSGGQMGELTRNYNWSQTTLGNPNEWPQSLRTTVSIMLRSKFPMFLWWGEDLVQFYNDAYRPSLGNDGKHPEALGQKGRECWPEIWHIIHPLILQVQTTGEAIWNEDKLVPIYRNGRLENVYWTFGYTPVYDDWNKPSGVLVTCTETTKKVEEFNKLQQSEKRFQNLISETAVGIIVLMGEEMVVEIVNDAYGKLIDRSYKDLIGKPLFDIIPETKPYFHAIIEKVRITGESFYKYAEPYFVLVDGFKKGGFLNLVYQPYKEDDGKITGVMLLCYDVTEQVLVRKKAEENEARLRSIIAAAPAGIGLFVGPDLVVEMPNQTFINIVGKGPHIEGKPLREIMSELLTEGQPFLQILNDVYTSGKMFQSFGSQVKIMQQGVMTYHYYNISYTPLLNAEGEVYAILDIAIDVTDQVLAKKGLEESERNLRNLVLQAPVAICILKQPEYILEIANDRMFELWGKPAEELMNKPIFEGLPEAKEQGLEALLYNVYTTGESFKAFELPINLPRGGKIETTYLNFVYEPFYEANASISGIIAVAVDVTEQVLARRKIEEVVTERTKELAEANNALQQNNKELEQFAYIASHDMQEPLRKVSTFTQMLEKSLGEVDERSKTYLHKIAASTDRMSQLIKDILNFSQLSKGRELFVSVDLNGVLENISSDFELLIEQKNAQINFTNLPVLQAVPLQMQQLFSNLLSNALKFCRNDVPPVININAVLLSEEEKREYPHLLPDRDYFLINVEDNGIGFNPEYVERIFGIFQRLHGKTEYAGTGIGLALCKKIAQNHHGEIWATSLKNMGAVFHIILPGQMASY